MAIKRYLRVGATTLLTTLTLGLLLLAPMQAAAQSVRSGSTHASGVSGVTSVNANIYLTSAMIKGLFQGQMDSQLPKTVGEIISSMVSQLPGQDQEWATQMANALLQPSASLVSLVPRANGLLAELKISLYNGDPKPTTVSILVSFRVVNASTVEVSASGSGLLSGPLLDFKIPIGALKSITMLSNCGSADLKVNLQFPLTLPATTSGQTAAVGQASGTTPLALRQATTATDAYVEIPASSLAQIGSGLGTMTVSKTITAQDVSISVEGSDLVFDASIYWLGLHIANAVSVMVPGASGGNLIVHVQSTNLEILDDLISIPINKYNQQIEQTVDGKLSGALTNKFAIAQAEIGPNAALPCAAVDSLVIGGTISL